MKKLIADEKAEFAFPLGFERNLVPERSHLQKALEEISIKWHIHQPTTASEFRELLESNTYVIMNFYSDFYATHTVANGVCFVNPTKEYGVPGILAFARANVDDMRDVASKYCKVTRQTYVFFHEGKPFMVNGKSAIYGEESQALAVAAKKLGSLAKGTGTL
jgi:hypothetical protein